MKLVMVLIMVMSMVVVNELEGLTSAKKEKTARAAEDALEFIKTNNVKLVGVNGKLIPGNS